MKRIISLVLLLLISQITIGQTTCTVSSGGNRTFGNIGSAPCDEGGTVDSPTTSFTWLVLDGINLSTTSNNQTLSGYSIEIGSGSVKVKSGGDFLIDGSVSLPSGAGLQVESGANVDSGTAGSDRLSIGGTVILKGNGSCTDPDGSADTSPPYCSADGFTGPTGFDENGETPSVLPIVLSLFEVAPQESSVSLNWQTLTEENFDFFSVERSEDGEHFYEISTVPGHGNSTQPIDYTFEDDNPLFGMSYYRLNAIDYDGSYEKFQIIAVEFVPDDLQAIIYPNPSSGSNLRIRLGLPKEASLQQFAVYSISGERLFQSSLSVGRNDFNLENVLQGGMYFAEIRIDNYVSTRKLIIN